jgi:hypothetical protein
MSRSGTKSDRVVSTLVSKASLDRIATGLVVGISVRVRAVALCNGH